MPEKVEKQPESISAIARAMSIKDRSFYDTISRHPSMRPLYVKSVELSEVEKIDNPVIVDFGGGGGILENVLQEGLRGRKFTYINLDFDPSEIRKSGGKRIVTSIIDSSLRENSADAVFLLNPSIQISEVGNALVSYVPKNINEEMERKILMSQFKKIYTYEERAPLCEAARIMKVGGRFVMSNQISSKDKAKFEIKEYVDDLIEMGKGKFLEKEKVQIFKLGPQVAVQFKLRDGQKAYSNFLMEVFVKRSNEGIDEALDVLREFKKPAEDMINDSFQSGILGRMKKEGMINYSGPKQA